jgi:hypothetical protein
MVKLVVQVVVAVLMEHHHQLQLEILVQQTKHHKILAYQILRNMDLLVV